MGDKMRLLPLPDLLARMEEEFRSKGSLFDIPRDGFFKKTGIKELAVFGETCSTPLGPAAGPHTQLVQNILASYLSGCRFIELKTVQKLDSLEFEKPCIDARDEGFNTEWSTELSLEQAWQEYAKAWILLHLMEALLEPERKSRGFIFNMSVGYDLEGIKTPKMDQYIERMIDSSREPLFKSWVEELKGFLKKSSLLKAFGQSYEDVSEKISRIPGKICRSVTLSTMHGCPPHEIEAICRYMLGEKALDTYVKLNPTLLGYDWVRKTLDDLGYDYVPLKKESFEHDLQYVDALGILGRLRSFAGEKGRNFGVKLTNTLGSVNFGKTLPGDEMYMSGRALFPLSINLAARLSREYAGTLPISYSGGIGAGNVSRVFKTGIRPVTAATELLKPGGYLRMKEMADLLEKEEGWEPRVIDVEALETLAAQALTGKEYRKDFLSTGTAKVPGDLPLFDCNIAPCVTACPINQHVPEYIQLAGEGRYAEALALIYERNALPSITGHICDHQCQIHCTRNDYEGCVGIREVKRLAVLRGGTGLKDYLPPVKPKRNVRAAVVGAGPAGLSAAYFLAREGFSVTVFEKEDDAGGVVRNVVPHFRITREAIQRDVDFIRDLGVEFVFASDPEMTLKELKSRDYAYVCLGIGAYDSRPFSLPGGEGRIFSSLEFLTRFNRDRASLPSFRTAAVMGAGDTAMDAARAALRCPGVEEVSIVYRRSALEMPASREEVEWAREDGVGFRFLSSPESFDGRGNLVCRVMALGEPDASGRRAPVPTQKTVSFRADLLISAIGDKPDGNTLSRFGLAPDARGLVPTDENLETSVRGVYLMGDGRTGPSTIVGCIAEGRKAADAICRKESSGWTREEILPSLGDKKTRAVRLTARKGRFLVPFPAGEDHRAYLENEALRCLECNFLCQKCVEVCPNRANRTVALDDAARVKGELNQDFQIVHIDAYCNECGNCGTFCPWEGNPYRDKPTVFSRREDLENSTNPGWYLSGNTLTYRLDGQVDSLSLAKGKVPDDFKKSTQAVRFFTLLETVLNESPALFAPLEEK